MIENKSVILLTEDNEILSLFSSTANVLLTKVVNKPDFASFLLEMQEHDYNLAICDCSNNIAECFKWVKVIKKIRPKVPLIVISSEIDKFSGAKLYEESIYHLCEKPIDVEYLNKILAASLNRSDRKNF